MKAEWIVASGSLPRGVPADFYAQAAAVATQRGQKFVLDTSGPPLRAAVGHGIELLKLSLGKLEFLIGREARNTEAHEREVGLLLRAKAANMIAVSLGSEGAMLGTLDNISRLPAMKVQERGAMVPATAFSRD